MKYLFLILFFAAVSLAAADFPLVRNGKAAAGIEIATEHPFCKEAAEVIKKYVKLVSGAELSDTKAAPKIVLKIEKGKQDIEGFSYTFPQKDVMVITAGGKWGIRYAAADFCERFLGVRFLYAGPYGEYLPQKKNISVPVKNFSDAPVFLSRYLTNGRIHPSRKRYQDWTVLLRGVPIFRVNYQHNIHKMFDSGKYGKTHPEFYPLHNGKRYIPRPGTEVHWQPCLTAPGILEETVRIVCEAFEKDQELICYSLAATDGAGFCECTNCRKFYPQPEKINSAGQPDRSRYLISFYNKVAEQVVKKYPHAKFGFGAYNFCQDPPEGMKLHPALIPGLTYDRYNWISPQRRKNNMLLHKKWAAVSSEVAWYDYFYNNTYVLPRIYPHLIEDIIKTGYATGVRHFDAEYYTIDGSELGKMWCDGPTAYLYYKLLWNPALKADLLLDEWYVCAVGRKAAPYLKKYFEELENFWMTKAWKTKWFSSHNYKIYLQWNDKRYMDLLDKNMLDRCTQYLDKMCELSNHKERAAYLRAGFLKRRVQILYHLNSGKIKDYPESAFNREIYTCNFDTPGSEKGWRVWKYRPSNDKAEIVPVKGQGRACRLRLLPKGNEIALERIIKIDNPEDLLIKVRFRCENTDNNAYPYISAEWCQDAEGRGGASVYYTHAAGNHSRNGWVLKCRLPAYPGKTGYLRIRLRGTRSSRGFIYFDDLKILSR